MIKGSILATAVSIFSLPLSIQRALAQESEAALKGLLLTSPLVGFNGQRRDPVTGLYLLGNGYRAYNPSLMRFHSMDSMSPFGEGGLNPYVYCLNDPINNTDSSGHFAIITSIIIGALVGAALGAAFNAGSQMIKNNGIDNFDWGDFALDVGLGAVTGAIGGGFGASAVGASLARKAGLFAAEELLSGSIGLMTDLARGKSLEDVAIGVGFGLAAGAAGFGLGYGVKRGLNNFKNSLNPALSRNGIPLSGRGAPKSSIASRGLPKEQNFVPSDVPLGGQNRGGYVDPDLLLPDQPAGFKAIEQGAAQGGVNRIILNNESDALYLLRKNKLNTGKKNISEKTVTGDELIRYYDKHKLKLEDLGYGEFGRAKMINPNGVYSFFSTHTLEGKMSEEIFRSALF